MKDAPTVWGSIGVLLACGLLLSLTTPAPAAAGEMGPEGPAAGSLSVALQVRPECPGRTGDLIRQGWEAYRESDMDRARQSFGAAVELCPESSDALTGLGYVELRAGNDDLARGLMESALVHRPVSIDALVGLGILAWRAGDLEEVHARFRRVQELDPGNPDAADYLGRLPEGVGPPPERPDPVLPDTVELAARTYGDRLEIPTPDGWRPFYVRGMNLGAALPGRFPGEFPQEAEIYRRWIQEMGRLGVNTIRVYTIHPPAFYRELEAYNQARPEAPLRLLHGVWAELPPGDDYLDPEWEGAYFREMRRVVDLLHGRADIEPRPGHASGYYTADVSRWVLGYILGREWEPHSVEAFNDREPEWTSFRGEYLTMERGTPMDAWLARASEEIIAYETQTYRGQRPVAYTTWPTLDPLHHPSEATVDEEEAIRLALGDPMLVRVREYDNDGVSVDPSLHRPTAAFTAGVFAAYHAYPYYPDFMILEEDFARATSSFGPSHYMGYLEALKSHHHDIPVVIAEYGLPASLGNSHIQPQGLHHGGLSESEQAEGNRRLTLEIAEAGMAGGALFAWIDEWFKLNWTVMEFEYPLDHRVRWINRLNSEQHYGVFAKEPVPPIDGETLDERRAGWAELPPLYTGPGGETLRATTDEAGIWLLVEPGATAPQEVYVGFDLVDPDRGGFRWPGARGPRLPVGVEFVLEASPDTVRLLAHPTQALFRFHPVELPGGDDPRAWEPEPGAVPPGFFQFRGEQTFNTPFRTEATEGGEYERIRMIVNRRRFTRDSTEVLAVGVERGLLPPGNTPDGYWEWDSDGALEVRIPWNLLNVTDPSTRTVLQGGASASSEGDGLEFQEVEGIGLVAALRDGGGGWRSLPTAQDGSGRASAGEPAEAGDVEFLRWDRWIEPGWRVRERPGFGRVQDAFRELDEHLPRGGAPGPADGWPQSPDASWGESAADTLTLRERADRAWVEGGDDDPAELYREVLERDPNDRVALLRLGLLTAWEDRHADALSLFDRLLELDPGHLEAATYRARVVAWSGDLRGALDALGRILERAPAYLPALEARAEFLEWAGEYEAAASAYGRVVEVSPDPMAGARRARGRTLISAGRLAEARAAYDSLLAEDPDDTRARLDLARTLALADRTGEAADEYRRVIEASPELPEAWSGLARTLTWGGRLPAGEVAWQRATELAPDDPEVWAGLVQNLRWQGRPQAAREAALEAEEDREGRPRWDGRTPGTLAEQLRWVRAQLAPAVDAALLHERDSDGHRAWTVRVEGRVPLASRLDLHVEGYRRELRLGEVERDATGALVSLGGLIEPGWRIRLGGGVAGASDGETRGRVAVQATSPARNPLVATLRASRTPLDVTAALVDTGVDRTETGVEFAWAVRPQWRITTGGGWSRFDGTVANDRWNGSAAVVHGGWAGWSVGVAGRAFGFDQVIADGYFSPEFFGLVEVPVRWRTEGERWGLTMEAAPGVQQIARGGDRTGVVRGSARLVRRWAPGRELGLSLGGSTTGLERLGDVPEDDYRYGAFQVDGRWAF